MDNGPQIKQFLRKKELIMLQTKMIEDDAGQIAKVNKAYLRLIESRGNDYKHDELFFEEALAIMRFIFSNCKMLQSEVEEAILTIGKTGWGKSTFLNYLNGADLRVTTKGGLRVNENDKEITRIGSGEGSTTLFPQYCQTSFGKVFDLPGDEETRGVVAEVINSLCKKYIGKLVRKVKILLLIPASSVTSEGSYGRGLKDVLSANDKFLKDINRCKQNMMIVFSFASRRASQPQNIVQNIRSCLKHEDEDLKKYQELIEYVIDNKRVKLFAKPSQEAEDGQAYSTPNTQPWKDHQKNKIFEDLMNMDGKKCNKDDFSVSSNPKINEGLEFLLRIFIQKIKQQFNEKFKDIQISGVQLKSFKLLLGKLRRNQRRCLRDFSQLFKTNGYFQLPSICQLEKYSEMLSQFLIKRKEEIKENWVNEKLQAKIAQLMEKIQFLCMQPGGDFRKHCQEKYLKVRPNSTKFNYISELFGDLHDYYQTLEKMKLEKNDQNSQFYDNIIEKIYERTIQEAKEVQQKFVDYQTVSRIIQVPTTKEQIEQQKKQRVAYRNQIEKYQEKVKKTRKVKKERETSEVRRLKGVLKFVRYTIPKIVVTYQDQQYEDWEQKQKQVAKPYIEEYYQEVKVHKQILMDEQIFETVPVEKTKRVIKYFDREIYRDEEIKKFNSQRYECRVNELREKISYIKRLIRQSIERAEQAEVEGEIDEFEIQGEIEENYQDLLMMWNECEHRALFKYFPHRIVLN